jgi:hypothetical protein
VSLDSEFRDWHNDKVVVAATNLNREWKRRGVQNVGLMVTRPLVDIVLGVTGGISGVIIAPVKRYKRNGPAGIPLGIAAGGIGLVVKPLVSLLQHVFFRSLFLEGQNLWYFVASIAMNRLAFWMPPRISQLQSMTLLRV